MRGGQRAARALRPLVESTVRDRGAHGATWFEVASLLGVHHGTASGALSYLHAEGSLARLTAKRGRCRVYVAPEHVEGRPTEERQSRACPACGHRSA